MQLLNDRRGRSVSGSLEKLREFYDRGVRMLTLTWNFPNEIGFPNFAISRDGEPDRTVPNTKDGLTEFGFLFLEEMERLGMIVDVSHLSDAAFMTWRPMRSIPLSQAIPTPAQSVRRCAI